MTNLEQAQAWDGDEGERWTTHEDQYNRAIRRHGERLLEAARVQGGERVLDIGCGCGDTTRAAARAAASASVLGVDLSRQMLEQARKRAREEGLGNVEFEQADAQVHRFDPGQFDLSISRFGVMFFDDPIAAFANIGTALRSGGRLVFICWADPARNEWVTMLRTALAAGRDLPEPPLVGPGPFGFANPEVVRGVLDGAGFIDVDLHEIEEPYDFGTDLEDALAFAPYLGVVKGLLADLDADQRRDALQRLRQELVAHEQPDGVMFGSTCWLVTATRP